MLNFDGNMSEFKNMGDDAKGTRSYAAESQVVFPTKMQDKNETFNEQDIADRTVL